MEFIQTADEVKTLATTDPFDHNNGGHDGLELARSTRIEEYKRSQKLGVTKKLTHAQGRRQPLIDFVKGLRDDNSLVAACFDPHHFVYASKGTQSIRIEICLTCHWAIFSGLDETAFPVGRQNWEAAEKVFGVDLLPYIRKIETAPK